MIIDDIELEWDSETETDLDLTLGIFVKLGVVVMLLDML